MIIGILSDTHDRFAAMKAGIETLQQAGASYFLHCGDIGGAGCIDLLAGLQAAFVFGNTDWDRLTLSRYAESIGVPCFGAFGAIELDGKKIALLHGDDFRLKQKIIDEQKHDYLFQGHTHLRDDRRVGKTRLINPGALHRAGEKTVATLDLETDLLRYHVVKVN